MTDKLTEIKSRLEHGNEKWDDVSWLVSELDATRSELADADREIGRLKQDIAAVCESHSRTLKELAEARREIERLKSRPPYSEFMEPPEAHDHD